jgi:hypothetical protein
VVAAREDVDSEREQVVRYLGRQPEAARGVLAVRDHRIDVMLLPGECKVLLEDLAARRADDVPDDEEGEGGGYDLALAFARLPVWTK